MPDHGAGLRAVLALFEEVGPRLADAHVVAVGHRVVQGGAYFGGPALVDEDVIAKIDELSPLAPLHNPPNLAGIRVAKKRVCRVMRENSLLSPHRTPKGAPDPHTGTITTTVPDAMWGTDGIRIETVDEGWVWVFSAVDHCTAECVGWHAAKIGSRFAALEPISQGLNRHFGSTGADAAHGLSLRFDHGTQYMADHFLNQVKFWGITASPAFVAEPQTNGVAERFNRTLKEQAIHGRVFRNLEAVRHAVGEFVERYNAHWRLEKLGFLSPLEARQAALLRKAA